MFIKRILLLLVGLLVCGSTLFAQKFQPLTPEEIAFFTDGEASAPMRVYLITNPSDSLLLRTPSRMIKANPEDENLQHFIQRLYQTVTDSASLGVGIAAPQVGVLRQIIWVQRFDKEGFPFEVFLNPRIIEYSTEVQVGPEGCLSIPNRREMISRAETIQIEYDAQDGSHRIESISGFTAVIFQHEIDHLNGILYPDHMQQEVADASPAIVAQASDYWQQRVKYQMDVNLDVNTHQFKGSQALTYFNHSPDTLKRVFYHLYFNAFQPGSMMDIRTQELIDPDRRMTTKISTLKEDEIGYQRVHELMQDGRKTTFRAVGTILEVELATPILPGDSTVLRMEFDGQVPVRIRRAGRDNEEGVAYTMTQWYPKLCEYDREGWHANPYIGREFHGVWGDFEVSITLDSSYVIGASGYLQNRLEVGHGYENPGETVQRPDSAQLTWHFVAPNVHDFAWGADPDFLHLRQQVPDGPELHYLVQDGEYLETWKKAQPFTALVFQLMAEQVGPYPYEQYSIVQGGDGGMEYAMLTMITGDRKQSSLEGVIAHEAIHSWFQHILATNESLYAWMDEGFTNYYDARISDQIYQTNLLNPQYGGYLNYVNLATSGLEEPSTVHADHFETSFAYARSAYSKGSVFLHQLSYVVGRSAFERGMKRYYREWKFKHPEPRHLKHIMEAESGLELDWYFQHWVQTTKQIDYRIASVKKGKGKTTEVTLERKGGMPMPVELLVTYEDGSSELLYFPLRIMRGSKPNEYNLERTQTQEWPWTNPSLTVTLDRKMKEISSMEIDPTYRMADVDRSNNVYPEGRKPFPNYGGVIVR